ncbi:hypothetical protein D9758_016109 [Tetrapyrgos nigripes]|uniref:F-box domain-containing protein n=1 Tax=Tetrapyrgos nigripes TaxID=182062 RepID=A0A8H5ERR4_9AGAR|nr:hypothetical protein D9758_018966 [Tetrapyrgos nigripes]KAF5332322.1 hypothetical protein D9758_016109 [Tetrapyrgos nigripes]
MPSIAVPFDVWSSIAEYITPDTLVALAPVNQAFYDIAQKVKYQVTDLVTYDKNTKKLLKDLQDPSLGSLVRTVHIRPWKVSDVVKPSPRRPYRAIARVYSFLDEDYAVQRAKEAVEKRLRKHIQLVLDAVGKLQNVVEYRIEWDETPGYHAQFFQAFLYPLLGDTSFGHSLTKFSLKVPVEKLPGLASVHLPLLQELDVHLSTGALPSQEVKDLVDSFVVFINNLYPTLRSFAVTSTCTSQNLDLNYLFRLLGKFPALRSLALSTPWDGVHVWAPSGEPFPLQLFIAKHARQLEELKFMGSRIANRHVPLDPEAKTWIHRLLAGIDDNYCLLSKLEVDIRTFRADLSPFFLCLDKIASQLESLVLTEYPLAYADVESLLQSFAHHGHGQATSLKTLAICLRCLTPEVIDLLAYGFPHLRSLELTFTEVSGAHFGNQVEKLVGRALHICAENVN